MEIIHLITLLWNYTTFYSSFDLVYSLLGCQRELEINRSMGLNCGGIRKIHHKWQNRRLVFKTFLKKNSIIIEKLVNTTIRQINLSIPMITRVPVKMQLWKYNDFTLWAKILILYEHFIYYSITNTLTGFCLNQTQCELSQILINFISLLRKFNTTCHSTSMYPPVVMEGPCMEIPDL